MKVEIPHNLLYSKSLSTARHEYACIDCNIKQEDDFYKYVIGFSYEIPVRSIIVEKTIAVVSECPKCFSIFWLHCTDKELRAFQRYKSKRGIK